jgi:uncharacterized protein (DUF2147 family)
MKLILSIVIFFIFQVSFSQTIFGKWKTVDDETGMENGIVEIYEKAGKVYGRIIEILEKEKKYFKCEMCEGEDKNKPVLGLVIIKGLKKKGDFYEGGKVTDPKNGKSYHCKMNLEGKDKLIVRGYIGISLFGRSQTWFRI